MKHSSKNDPSNLKKVLRSPPFEFKNRIYFLLNWHSHKLFLKPSQ